MSKMYYEYKNRLENHPVYKEILVTDEEGKVTDQGRNRRNNMALRFADKRFLVDLHVAWRTLEGLPFPQNTPKPAG